MPEPEACDNRAGQTSPQPNILLWTEAFAQLSGNAGKQQLNDIVNSKHEFHFADIYAKNQNQSLNEKQQQWIPEPDSYDRSHRRSPNSPIGPELFQPPKTKGEIEFASGLRSVEKALESIGRRRESWDKINLRINLEEDLAERGKLLELRRQEFPEAVKHMEDATNDLSSGTQLRERELAATLIGRFFDNRNSTIHCHRAAEQAPTKPVRSDAQDWLTEELKGLTAPSNKVKADYYAEQIRGLNLASSAPFQNLLGQYRAANPDNWSDLARVHRLCKDWTGSSDGLLDRADAILFPPRTENQRVKFVKYDGASVDFGHMIEKAVAKLPKPVLDLLDKNGCQIVVTPKTSKELFWTLGTPRGLPAGSTYDSPAGMTVGMKVVVAERTEDKGTWNDSKFPAETAWHETGHAVNRALGNYCDSPEFQAAYERDKANMTEAEMKTLDYLLQKTNGGHDGRNEAFAECFANIVGSHNSDREVLNHAFPEVHKVIRARLAKLK